MIFHQKSVLITESDAKEYYAAETDTQEGNR